MPQRYEVIMESPFFEGLVFSVQPLTLAALYCEVESGLNSIAYFGEFFVRVAFSDIPEHVADTVDNYTG